MEKRNYTYKSYLLLLTIYLFSSCSEETINIGEPPINPGGTEYLSVNVQIEKGLQTRATSIGIEDEWNIKSMRFVLYSDELTGTAVLVHDYNIYFDNVTWNIIPVNNSPANLKIEGPLTAPHITKDFEKLIKQDYRLLVMINHNSGTNINLNMIMHDGQPLNLFMNSPNHSMSILSNPIDLSLAGEEGKGKNVFNYGIGPGLTGLSINYPVYPNNFIAAAFFMSNADGLVFINKETNLFSSLEAAKTETNRAVVNVERAVAKISIVKGSDSKIRAIGNDIYVLMNGSGLLASLTWTSDIINYYWFIIRKQANIAPGQGGGLESSTNNRQLYYAEDPNYSGISELKTGHIHTGESQPSYHFFRVENGEDIKRNWIENSNSGDEENKFRYEYIPENTMRADEQYEDVATRVLIRTNFVPLMTLEGTIINVGDSYYYYNGYAFTHAQICYYLAYPDAISSLPPELQSLKNVLFNQEVIDEFGFADGEVVPPITRSLVDPDNPPKEPTVSKTKNGLTYYLHGISYYYIMIRHFTDTESPGEGTYGRYGVVRNNVYKITIEDITGPGYIDIPQPSGGRLKSKSTRNSEHNNMNAIQAITTHEIWSK